MMFPLLLFAPALFCGNWVTGNNLVLFVCSVERGSSVVECRTRMLPREVELVPECTVLPGGEV